MKYLKSYKENIETELSLVEVIKKIQSGELEPEDIENYFNIDYKYIIEDCEKDYFSIVIDFDNLHDLMDIDGGILSWIDSIHQYEIYVDNEELNYIHYGVDEEFIKKIINFSKYLDCEIDWDWKNKYNNDEKIVEFLLEFNLECIMTEFTHGLSEIKEIALEKCIRDQITNEEPFSYKWRYNSNIKNGYIIDFQYENILDFIEKYKLNPFTISEFLKDVGNTLPYTYELEWSCSEYETKKQYDDLRLYMNNIIDKYWYDDYKFPTEHFWVNCVNKDLVDVLKKHFNDVDWYDTIRIYGQYNYLVEIAKENSKVYKWIVDGNFDKRIKKGESKELDKIIYEMQAEYNAKRMGLL
jgi:hypothetical protein